MNFDEEFQRPSLWQTSDDENQIGNKFSGPDRKCGVRHSCKTASYDIAYQSLHHDLKGKMEINQ